MKLTLSIRSAGTPTGILATPYTVDRGSVRIGRAPECELVLPDANNRISRLHCRIDWDGDGYVLTDSSALGTIINGSRVNGRHRLVEGEVLTIGDYQIGVSMASQAGGTRAGVNLDSWNAAPPPPSAPRPPVQLGASAAPTVTTLSNAAAAAAGGDAVSQLLAAAGISRNAVPLADAAVLATSGALLRQLVTGLAATLAARARARSELGVANLASDAANPILNDPPLPTIVADMLRAGPNVAVQQTTAAFRLAEAHQRATLHAMQGALAQALESIAPAAIRARTKGNEAAMWKAYEAAFAGTADKPGFVELFASELGAAYEKLAAAGPIG